MQENTSLFHVVKRKRETAELATGVVVKTYHLCCATQRHFAAPRLVAFAACAKPGLCLVDGMAPSFIHTKTRSRKVRVRVVGTLVSIETDGLEIVGCGSAKGELNGIALHGRKGTG